MDDESIHSGTPCPSTAHTFLWIDEWTTEKGNWAISATGEAGFDFIEISLMKPDEFDAVATKKALAAAGIEAKGSLVLPEWAHMPEQPVKARQFLTSALEKLEAIGATYLGGCIAFALGKFTGDRQVVVDTLGEVRDARKRGITLGIEVTIATKATYTIQWLIPATILAIGKNIKIRRYISLRFTKKKASANRWLRIHVGYAHERKYVIAWHWNS
jgi:hypothetical protein